MNVPILSEETTSQDELSFGSNPETNTEHQVQFTGINPICALESCRIKQQLHKTTQYTHTQCHSQIPVLHSVLSNTVHINLYIKICLDQQQITTTEQIQSNFWIS